MWQMKRDRASTPTQLLSLSLAVKVTALLLAGHRVRSFSNTHHCSRNRNSDRDRGCQWSFSQSPRVALRAGNDDKLDWNPKSNPKIARLPSYSDDWLLNFHNRDQSQKQLATNSLAAWNEEIRNQQATIIEWQDSFQRNYLADFTPPMSNGLNCLMVGGDFDVYDDEEDGTRRLKLPWEDVPEAQITSLRVLEDSIATSVVAVEKEEDLVSASTTEENDDDETIIIVDSNNNDEDKDASVSERSMVATAGANQEMLGTMLRTELVSVDRTTETNADNDDSSSTTALRVMDPNKPVATYDCIVDQGLMDRVLALASDNNAEQTVHELLEEAAMAMKEFGIYVLTTKTLTEDSRELLERYGLEAGFEWQFELDGISNDSQVVSVARRFNNGAMPKVGRLSRYQP
mmetsp:Transcript_9180/g.19880  ORF Transcript_9180/g.19880 Transcript_9180/m.19880 type:complete len:402 (-) Transcript_9180:280-1485(-)